MSFYETVFVENSEDRGKVKRATETEELLYHAIKGRRIVAKSK